MNNNTKKSSNQKSNNKPYERQFTLGAKDNNVYPMKKNIGLKFQEKNNKNDSKIRKQSQVIFDYGSHQYIQTQNPKMSPKFNTHSSIQKDSYQSSKDILGRVSRLNPLMQKIITQCQDENQQVVQGLIELKQAYRRILYQLKQQSLQQINSKKYGHINHGERLKDSIKYKMKQLTSILNKIIKISPQVKKRQIKENIQDLKNIQNDFQEEQSLYEKNYRKKQSFQSDQILIPSKKFTTESIPFNVIDQQDQNYDDDLQSLEANQQPIELDMLENKIVKQINALRRDKIKLSNQLQQEKKKGTILIKQIKKLQKISKKKSKTQNKDSQYQDQTIINILKKGSSDYTSQKNSTQSLRLKLRIKQLQNALSKINDNRINNNKSSQIKLLKEKLEKKSIQFQQNKMNYQDIIQQNKILKNELNKMRKFMNQFKEIQKDNNFKPAKNQQLLMRELKKLKKQNQQLRIQTIQIMKHKNLNSHPYRSKTQAQQNYRDKQFSSKFNNISKRYDARKYSNTQENTSIPLTRPNNKKSNQSNRLKEYKELLLGLQSITPKSD